MKVRLFNDHQPENQGTVLLFDGEVMGGQYDGLAVRVVVDHRPARSIMEALTQGVEVEVEPEPWQVML